MRPAGRARAVGGGTGQRKIVCGAVRQFNRILARRETDVAVAVAVGDEVNASNGCYFSSDRAIPGLGRVPQSGCSRNRPQWQCGRRSKIVQGLFTQNPVPFPSVLL